MSSLLNPLEELTVAASLKLMDPQILGARVPGGLVHYLQGECHREVSMGCKIVPVHFYHDDRGRIKAFGKYFMDEGSHGMFLVAERLERPNTHAIPSTLEIDGPFFDVRRVLTVTLFRYNKEYGFLHDELDKEYERLRPQRWLAP